MPPRSIPLLTQESRLKRDLRKHLKQLGFVKSDDGSLVAPSSTKDAIRSLHAHQRRAVYAENEDFTNTHLTTLGQYFADGSEICPANIKPRLESISAKTWQSNLFRLASLTWSVPVSRGFGRRIRFLVWDDSCDKLIGIFAIGDPVFNLNVRDKFVGWSAEDRRDRLTCVMDAYVLGAIPPYNDLLCGKLMACLLSSREVIESFNAKYCETVGVISGKQKKASLALITTTSALGKSSVYNRLTLEGRKFLTSVGTTSGWGHFHISNELFEQMRLYLSDSDDEYGGKHAFGDGPNWRLRVAKHAISKLGMSPGILKHGVKREVFVREVARNARNYLQGKAKRCNYRELLSCEEIADLCVRRWIVPRAQRKTSYKECRRDELLSLISGDSPKRQNTAKRKKSG